MDAIKMDAGVLRRFGLTVGAALAVVFGLLLPWLWAGAYPLWPWLAGSGLALLGWLKPAWLTPIYRSWMRLALALGWLNTRLILSLVFYGFMTPVALILRWTGKDPLHRRFDPGADSYRVAATPRPDTTHFERPF
jgi:hypothetical protein